MAKRLLYLDNYVVQKDSRIRLPKSVLSNFKIEKGKDSFDFYLDPDENCLVLKLSKEKKENQEND